MWKTSGSVFLGHLRGLVFYNFQGLHSIPDIFHGICVDYVAIFNSSPVPYLRWSSLWRKTGNDWKLLLIVVTYSFVLNVTGLLDPNLKFIDKFRLSQ